MIGGSDVIFPAVGDSATLEACARIVGRRWPKARFEDAISGEKYARIADIAFGQLRELLVYPNAEAEAAWDADREDSPENSMLNLIIDSDALTVVLDNPNSVEMRSILNDIGALVWTDVYYARAA